MYTHVMYTYISHHYISGVDENSPNVPPFSYSTRTIEIPVTLRHVPVSLDFHCQPVYFYGNLAFGAWSRFYLRALTSPRHRLEFFRSTPQQSFTIVVSRMPFWIGQPERYPHLCRERHLTHSAGGSFVSPDSPRGSFLRLFGPFTFHCARYLGHVHTPVRILTSSRTITTQIRLWAR